MAAPARALAVAALAASVARDGASSPPLFTADTSDPAHTVLSVPPSCNPTCTGALNAAIAACAATGGSPACTVSLEAASYTLDGPLKSTRLTVTNAKNFAFVGAGAAWPGGTLLLLTDIAQVFVVNGGANHTYSGFAVDMERVPFTYGQVVSANPTSQTSVVAFDSTPPLYPVDTGRYPWLLGAQGVLSFDPVNRRVAPDDPTDIYALNTPLPITYTNITNGPGSTFEIGQAVLKPQDWVIIRHQTYSFNAFSVFAVDTVRVLNVTLYCVAGMGLYTEQCSGAIDVVGLRVERLPARPMSITADGMHFSDTRGAPVTVSGCLLEGQGDDGLNIPTIFQAIVNVSADRTVVALAGRGPAPPVVRPGDTMNVFNRSSVALLGTVPVLAAYANGTVVLAAPLPAGAGVNSAVNSANSYASSFTLTDNVFSSNRARGALIKTSNALVAGNLFVNVSGPAIKSETDGCYWFEGHPVSGWVVENNTFSGVNYAVAAMPGDVMLDNAVPVFVNGQPTTKCVPYTGTAPAMQSNLTFSGNAWTQISGQSAITAESVAGLTIVGNVVTRAQGAPVPAADFVGEGVVGAAVSGNTCDGAACKTSGL